MNRKATAKSGTAKRGTSRKEKTQEDRRQEEPSAPIAADVAPAATAGEPTEAEIAEALDRLHTPALEEESDVMLDHIDQHLIIEDDHFDGLLEEEVGDERDDMVERTALGINGDHLLVRVPRLVEPSSNLLAHCGTRKITREELKLIPTPEGTRTHQPLAHISIVESLVETLAFRHIHVVREEYAVSPDGARMFGVLDLDYEYATLDSFRFSIGLRNANDKTMRLGMTIGYRVFVCDNMAFRGDFTPVLAKHTRKLDLEEALAIGVDRMQRGFEPLREQITGWQQRELSDDTAKLVIYEAFLDGALPLPRHLLPIVHRHYFRPEYEAFLPRTLWSLLNAFTSSFKELKPVRQFQSAAKLGGFIAAKAGALQDTQAMLPIHEEIPQVMHA